MMTAKAIGTLEVFEEVSGAGSEEVTAGEDSNAVAAAAEEATEAAEATEDFTIEEVILKGISQVKFLTSS